jgi:hypothetical protein
VDSQPDSIPPKESVPPGTKANIGIKVYGGTPPYTLSLQTSGEMQGTSANIAWPAPELIGPYPVGVMFTDKNRCHDHGEVRGEYSGSDFHNR